MPIQREGQFLRFHNLGITSSLGIESTQLQACLAEVRAAGLKGVFGCPGFDFREETLDFLRELPWVEQVWFWDVNLKSVEGLYALPHLRYFGVHERRPGLDFAHFPELETVVWFHNPKDKGLAALPRLTKLHVWHYKPKEKSFAGLGLPTSLERLEFTWANPHTLEGLPLLPNLRRLELHHCRNLLSLDGLAGIAPGLRELVVTSCNKLAVDLTQLPAGLGLPVINGRQLV